MTEQRESEPTGQATSAVTTLMGPGTPQHSYFIIHYQKSQSLISLLSQSAQDAVTKYHTLNALNNRPLSLTTMKAEKSKIKVPINFVPDERALAGL